MSAVFLDLDGTLVDSRPGILASLRHAFMTIGRTDLVETDLTWMIGPPFTESFEKIGLSDPEPPLAAYRDHYRSGGMFDATVYDGVTEAMDRLISEGCRLYLATAKPHDYALEITAHFGLASRMVAEFGPELDGTRNWKGDLLRHALELTGEDPARSVMVGDRLHDMAAAKEVGMASIAVSWGYGQPDEWATANSVIDHPSMLADALRQAI
ncbi:MAG: HAD hydrolase-like protein [Silicimonas sp.]|nr:HAD hydrolase-like protein [Silicimonas sp.]NNF90029.1 HAD hydrolase-like protein [Boseongicola sp.]RZW12793.1 MAG: HAD family hydrolase [Paracoccaceae bacterium]NND19505.1 HAD hydrolase-like protein [Silicimonas sp.]NND21729.1 HAD hydrolase-like protein [Silicimonas sp.]